MNIFVYLRKSLAKNEAKRRSWIDISIFLFWLLAVCFLAFHHVMWRDEVRALSIALRGDNIVQMLKGLHGEGHPAVWYLLLRGAHSIVGRVEVLPIVAFVVAVATVALLIFRSPFPRLLIAGLVFSSLLCFEYSVMARNYGISVLILFLIAEAYREQRDRGVVVGLLLFLLANTNVVGALMVAPFLLFWFVDVLDETRVRWTAKLGNFFLNASIAGAGVVVCGLTILPTLNDAATRDWSNASPFLSAVKALFDPGSTPIATLMTTNLPSIVASAIIFCIAVGLMSRRAAFISALFGIIASALFFSLATSGTERHLGVWFFFCITLYWIAWEDIAKAISGDLKSQTVRMLTIVGLSGLVVLVAMQAYRGIKTVGLSLAGKELVVSRSSDLGQLISSRRDLSNAAIVAEPDYMVEALPYYVPNRTYLVRQHSFGNVVIFSRAGKLSADLGEVLEESRTLKKATGAPVIILLSHRLDQLVPDQFYAEGYNWTFKASADQIREFKNTTKLLSQFGPAKTDETYDVYLLD
jgi:hypothetical protein